MAPDLQTIYCDSSFLDKAIRNRVKEGSPFKIAYSIIESIGNLNVNLSSAVLKERISQNPIYNKLSKRANLGIIPLNTEDSVALVKDFKDIDDELFLLKGNHKSENESKREKYGCLIISEDDVDYLVNLVRKDTPILLVPKGKTKENINGRILYRSDPYIVYKDSWDEVLSPVIDGNTEKAILPLNAMVISDNYMFTSKFQARKEYSLFAILKNIIPQDLDVDFHLSIFTSNAHPDKNWLSKEDAESLINEIRKFVGVDKIKIEIVAHDVTELTHDRHIATNYHLAHSGKGFSVIDVDGIQEVAQGGIESVFCNIDANSVGMLTKKHTHNQMMEWLSRIRYSGLDGSRPDYYVVGDDFDNRLLRKYKTKK